MGQQAVALSYDAKNIEEMRRSLSENLDEIKFFNLFIEYLTLALKESHISFEEVLFYRYSQGENFKLISEKELDIKSEQDYSINPIIYSSKTKIPYFCNDCGADPLFKQFRYGKNIIKSIIYPVVIEGEVLGIISIGETKESSLNYNYDHISVIKDFIKGLISPLRNMQMFLSVKGLNEQLLKKIRHFDAQNSLDLHSLKNQITVSSLVGGEKMVGKSVEFLKTVDLIDRKSYTSGLLLFKGPLGVGKEFMARRIAHQHKASFVVLQMDKLLSISSKERVLEQIEEEISHSQYKTILLLKGVSHIQENQRLDLIFMIKKILGNKRVGPIILHFEGTELYPELERLSADIIEIPALGRRKEDITLLAKNFIEIKSKEKLISSSALKALESYDWPENIDELQNYIDCAYTMSSYRSIELSHLPDVIKIKESGMMEKIQLGSAVENQDHFVIEETNFYLGDSQIEESDLKLASIEKRHICLILEQLKGNKTKAAKTLGITVKTLYNKLHLYGMVQ